MLYIYATNYGKEVSKASVVLLSLEATAYHIAINMPSSMNADRKPYYASRFSTAMMIYFWMTLFIMISDHFKLSDDLFKPVIIMIIAIEAVIYFTCKNKIEVIQANYSRHYHWVLWLGFLLFIAGSFLYWFNSQIGHLPADYNKHN